MHKALQHVKIEAEELRRENEELKVELLPGVERLNGSEWILAVLGKCHRMNLSRQQL